MIAVRKTPSAQVQTEDIQHRLEELQQSVSASRLALWHGCRLKFLFRYVLRIKKPPSASMHSGATVHAVLQSWNLSRWHREPFTTHRCKEAFAKKWRSLQAGVRINWDGEEEVQRSSSWRALEHYFAETPIRAGEKPEAVEVTFSADLSKHGLPTLIGIIDLVRAGGRIVDFKLVGKTPDTETLAHLHGTQLTAYSVLYRDATGRYEGGLELHHLIRTKQPKLIVTPLPPATEQQRARLFRSIESYADGLGRQDFVPSPGFACVSCEFIKECRKWNP